MDTVKIKSNLVNMIAHRGLSGLERENTFPAFVAAGNRSYFGIETDVRKTKDGKFIIIHDNNIERISLGKLKTNVEENDFSSVENIVLPDLDGSRSRRDIKIPLLTDYIKICKKYCKKCVLELKDSFSEEDIKAIIKEISGEQYLENVVFISFVWENCITVRKLLPQNDVQWLTWNEITDEIIKSLYENKIDLDVAYKALTRELTNKLHSYKIKVNCWTCDDKDDAEKLVQMGVDFITTNILEGQRG